MFEREIYESTAFPIASQLVIMTSPEIKETTPMSMEALQKRITTLEQENKRLRQMITDIGRKADDSSRQCSRLDYQLNNKIEDVLSKVSSVRN